VIDYYRVSLAGFLVIAIALCFVAAMGLLWPPPPMMFFGILIPSVAVLLWIVVVVLAMQVHRWRGLWLLVTAIVMIPVAYLHTVLVLGCVFFGSCL
jgi:hypothetical protein